MTGAEYLIKRIADLELTVAQLLDQKMTAEKERDELKARAVTSRPPSPAESAFAQANTE